MPRASHTSLQRALFLALAALTPLAACQGGQISTPSDGGCSPTPCAKQGKNCGSISDGCGGLLDCGACTSPQSCGGAGSANVCGSAACTPTTCAAQGKSCGNIADGCGDMLSCGTCDASQVCTNNVCIDAASFYSLPPDRATAWNPGILRDVPLGLPLDAEGLPQRTTVCKTVSPGQDVQAAIDGCPADQVVQLTAGTFHLSDTLQLKSHVILRGAGSDVGGTILVKNGGAVIAIGTEYDQVCYSGNGRGVDLTADAPKESTLLSVGNAASNFQVGDLVVVDQADVSPVSTGDCTYFKRNGPDGYRSLTQVDDVVAVDTTAGVLTLGTPLHWAMKAGGTTHAQVVRQNVSPTTSWAGIEDLHLQGGTNPGYNGQTAGGIDISNAAFCWVKNVQTDETIGGMHIRLAGTYRSVVRDSHVHHSADYGYAQDCYGIVIGCFSADNLVENNIVRYMNKPILTDVSGGGNVIAYNYADNAWAENDWEEMTTDEHCSFAHMELLEGNWATVMGLTVTHGNAGAMTFFRNYASSMFDTPSVANACIARGNNIVALELQTTNYNINVVGNVLGKAGVTQVYDNYTDSAPASIYSLGQGDNGQGQNDVVVTTLLRTGNYDYFNNATKWADGHSVTLPPSLYLKGAPAWWPSGVAWPWVGPDLSPMIQHLPAKDRSNAVACTVNCSCEQ